MSSSEKTTYDDALLINYLVGSLPAEDAERLDELSVTDDALALRLEALENDLVDSWARGQLSGEIREQFNRTYVSSPERINKLRFGQALVAHQARAATAESSRAGGALRQERSTSMWSAIFTTGGFGRWALAGIALLALLGSAYLAVDNSRLRRELIQEAAQRQALEKKQQQLSRDLALAGTAKTEAKTGVSSRSSSDQSNLISVLLLPALRDATDIQRVSIPAKTTRVLMRLQLEADDFPAYRAVLMESNSRKPVWRSRRLTASFEMGKRLVHVEVPADLLKSQNYLMQLTGVRAAQEEMLGTYPFRAIAE